MASALPMGVSGRGLLRISSPQEVYEHEQRVAESEEEADQLEAREQWSDLAAHIKKQFDRARRARDAEGITERLLNALRQYRGQYDAQTLAEIEKFGGSKVYSRLTSAKCRGASALLRDVFLSGERPWAVEPTPKPRIPENIEDSIMELVQMEYMQVAQAGQPPPADQIQARIEQLAKAARESARKKAKEEAHVSSRKLDDILTEGEFYRALSEFLVDLPIFPYAILKGPTVRQSSRVRWGPGGVAEKVIEPRMFWSRVSPFDVWFTPGASNMRNTAAFERVRYSREDLVSMLGVAGYNQEALQEAISRFDDGHMRSWFVDQAESTRAKLEERNRVYGTGDFMEGLEYHGYVSGKDLNEFDDVDEDVYDPMTSYFADVYMVDELVLKVHVNPSPRERVPYYCTSFEKVPGTLSGNGLPDMLEDIQSVMNATLRSLVNNLSISSGPQVVVRRSAMSDQDSLDLYPWKRWVVDDEGTVGLPGNQRPVDFYQPNSNQQELLVVYEKFSQMADEVSAIPRYLTGSDRVGGAGRTASGLAMLMNNASKVMQNVAFNIDTDILEPCIKQLYDILMLTDDTGILNGDEEIVVRGVTNSMKAEQDRVRQLEMLQLTANPIDASILGPEGRAHMLRQLTRNLGFNFDLVPDEEAFAAALQAGEANANQQAPNEAAGDGQQPHMNLTRNTM